MRSIAFLLPLMLASKGNVPAFDLHDAAVAGDPKAPVTLVEYACARCPFCAKFTPELYDAVVSGPLKGKAKLYLRVFPLKSHPGAKEAALSFEAAQALGAFWPFALHAFRHFDEFTIDRRLQWAEQVGLDPVLFTARMTDPALVDKLIAIKKEGIVNGVDGTPTLFINDKKYDGKHTLADITAAVEAARALP